MLILIVGILLSLSEIKDEIKSRSIGCRNLLVSEVEYYISDDSDEIEVCEEWLNFQNFAEWCYGQKFFDAKDDKGRSYHLDKDILVKGNRVYSPNTCSFVPAEINSLVVVNKRRRGDTPIGVYYVKRNRKYTTQCCFKGSGLKYLGSYSTPEEAFQVYKEAKKVSIKLVADQWKSKIEDKVYQSLLNWEITFDD